MSGAPTSPTRKFLMAHPRPMKVRLHVPGEAAPRELPMQPGQSWAKWAQTIDALQPTVIEALDAAGALLRARNPELDGDGADDEAEAAEIADPTTPLVGDGPLETFARLLADAHRTSGERAFSFVETAFARMVDIVNSQTVRLDRMQTLVDSMHRRFMRDASAALNEGEPGETPDGGQALLAQMIGQFVTAAASAQRGGATNGAAPAHGPNGAGGTKGGG